MRMYNPEWEAIKDMQLETHFRDLQFDLDGHEIPADHGAKLFDELARHLPWLRDTPEAGILPIHGAPTGRNANLVINRRVKLVLRLPIARLADAQALIDTDVDLGTGRLHIGALKERPLIPFSTLYSPFVALAEDDEGRFLEAARQRLEAAGIRCGLIPGKQRRMQLPREEIRGYSLMLHDVDLRASLAVQESGLGDGRCFGCGIFVPHKSIKEVSRD